MGDTKPPMKRESIPSAVICPMLSSSNYIVWAKRMKVLLRVHKVWETIDPGTDKEEKNDIATALLFQSIPENLILQVGEDDSPKEIWEAIKSRNLGAERVKEARLQTLMNEFDRLRMNDSDTIDTFSGKLFELASKAASLGQRIDEPKIMRKFLNSLPQKFIHMTASLEQMLDLNKTTFEDIIGRLKAYEERIKEEDSYEQQGNLLYSNSERSYEQSESSNSRGRGRGWTRGRGNKGRGRGKNNYEDKNKEKRDYSQIVCFNCKKKGHFASVCPEKKDDQELNKTETETADIALYMHEIVFLNEEKVLPNTLEPSKKEDGMWYLDNGASNHMTGEKSYFSELNENVKGKVKFGDGSCVDINGKGSILFEGITGEQKLLTDIYYIPELKSNILSLGQATEQGCDVRMRENYLTLRDPTGRLLIKVLRASNRLYKVSLKVGRATCLLSKIKEEPWRWHARLGHINFKTIRSMAAQDMVQGLLQIRVQDFTKKGLKLKGENVG